MSAQGLTSLLRNLNNDTGEVPRLEEDYRPPHHRVPGAVNYENRPDFVQMLAQQIAVTPLEHIAATLSSLSYGDMMKMAKELQETPPGDTTTPEVIAAWLYKWATRQREPDAAQTHF